MIAIEQLPYYKEGNAILSQTYAILKYLGRKHGLAAKNDKEQLRIDLIEAEAQDIRSSWADVMYYSGDNFVRNLNILYKYLYRSIPIIP